MGKRQRQRQRVCSLESAVRQMEYVESGRCNKKIENLREALADLEEELERLHKSLRRESRQKKPKTSLIDSIKRQIERKQRQINGVRHKINMQYEIINTATDRLTDAKKGQLENNSLSAKKSDEPVNSPKPPLKLEGV